MGAVGIELSPEDVSGLLRRVAWFSELSEAELDALTGASWVVAWAPGETVFEEGDRGDCCYVIERGSVRVLRELPDGRRLTLTTLGPGEVMGELALFGDDRRTATVQANESTVAVAVAGENLLALLGANAAAALHVVASLADRVRVADQRLLENALATPPGRVVATLLAQVEARQAQDAGERDVELVGTPADIAQLAGADREETLRILHWLENEGVIDLRRGRTTVRDPATLRTYVG